LKTRITISDVIVALKVHRTSLFSLNDTTDHHARTDICDFSE